MNELSLILLNFELILRILSFELNQTWWDIVKTDLVAVHARRELVATFFIELLNAFNDLFFSYGVVVFVDTVENSLTRVLVTPFFDPVPHPIASQNYELDFFAVNYFDVGFAADRLLEHISYLFLLEIKVTEGPRNRECPKDPPLLHVPICRLNSLLLSCIVRLVVLRKRYSLPCLAIWIPPRSVHRTWISRIRADNFVIRNQNNCCGCPRTRWIIASRIFHLHCLRLFVFCDLNQLCLHFFSLHFFVESSKDYVKSRLPLFVLVRLTVEQLLFDVFGDPIGHFRTYDAPR